MDFARIINCNDQSLKSNICACDPCSRVISNTHPDVIHIDKNTICSDNSCCKSSSGASIKNCVVSEFVISKSKYKPFMSEKKIIIIDNAEDLTDVSAESLLKTLEEENPSLIIILLVKDLDHIPDTIVSRCQVWKLRNIEKSKLKKILKEMFPEDEKNLEDILSFGDTAIGTAIEMVKHPIMLELKKETYKRILQILNGTMFEKLRYSKELSNLLRKDKKMALIEIDILKMILREMLIWDDQQNDSDIYHELKNLHTKTDKISISKSLEQVRVLQTNISRNANSLLALDNLFVNLEV